MSKFKVEDRVALYFNNERRTGTIVLVHPEKNEFIYEVLDDSNTASYWLVSEKCVRRLKPKEKPEPMVGEWKALYFENASECRLAFFPDEETDEVVKIGVKDTVYRVKNKKKESK